MLFAQFSHPFSSFGPLQIQLPRNFFEFNDVIKTDDFILIKDPMRMMLRLIHESSIDCTPDSGRIAQKSFLDSSSISLCPLKCA